jgi:hypothetical protein
MVRYSLAGWARTIRLCVMLVANMILYALVYSSLGDT